jgi:CBS domain-containing protein
MLSRPLWCQPVSGFRDTLREWIHGSDPEGPMNLAIFLDAAPAAGDATLLDEARDAVDRMLSGSDAFYARFAAAVEQFGGEGGWWSRLRGQAAAEVDLKKLGLFPIVHGVRTLALQYRVRERGTADRLRALVAGGHIDAALANDVVDALHLLIGLKLASNLRQISEGRAPDTLVRLSERGTLERQSLKEALAIVRRFRQWLGRHYRLDLL